MRDERLEKGLCCKELAGSHARRCRKFDMLEWRKNRLSRQSGDGFEHVDVKEHGRGKKPRCGGSHDVGVLGEKRWFLEGG